MAEDENNALGVIDYGIITWTFYSLPVTIHSHKD
jgi:hypothetical protein